MIPWELLDTVTTPDGSGELRLSRRGAELSIRIDGLELMNSRAHGSEDALAERGCALIADRKKASVLIGGLGMGFTLRAALTALRPDARVVVAEVVPAVVHWNRGVVGEVAGRPMDDPRVSISVGDVGRVMADEGPWDAILLDVDNGPEGLTLPGNDRLYSAAGLARAIATLTPGGVFAVWSAGPNPAFTRRLQRAGFDVDEVRVRARRSGKGGVHLLWLARLRAGAQQGKPKQVKAQSGKRKEQRTKRKR